MLCACTSGAASVAARTERTVDPRTATSVSRGVSRLGLVTVRISRRSLSDAEPLRPESDAGWPLRM